MTVTTVISAQNLSLTFETNDGPVQALKDVSLDIKQGEFVSFIGPSGCGKTTFLRVMADLEQPTSGTITVNGDSPAVARQARAYGYVFQAAGLYPWRTIGGNIRLPLEIMGYSKSNQAARVKQVLELVDLSDFEKKFPWQLSGGMQQRASIARALAFDADILLMDEPFSALDVLTAENLRNDLVELWQGAEHTKSILFVTHNIEEAVLISDRVLVFGTNPGKIQYELKVDLPYPRNSQDPKVLALIDDVYKLMTRAQQQEELNLKKAQEQLPGKEHLLNYRVPETTVSELIGLLEQIF